MTEEYVVDERDKLWECQFCGARMGFWEQMVDGGRLMVCPDCREKLRVLQPMKSKRRKIKKSQFTPGRCPCGAQIPYQNPGRKTQVKRWCEACRSQGSRIVMNLQEMRKCLKCGLPCEENEGLCPKHYAEDPEYLRREGRPWFRCSRDGCDQPAKTGRRMCQKHLLEQIVYMQRARKAKIRRKEMEAYEQEQRDEAERAAQQGAS